MTLRRMTIQDLADACGLSRNTVSKVLNDRGSVPETTRQAVLKKAQELGFYQFVPGASAIDASARRSIALLSRNMPADNHFGTFFIPAFAGFLSRSGYTLEMYELTEAELREKRLPESISVERTAAFIAIELFDCGYHRMLSALERPVLLVDDCSGSGVRLMEADRILMENSSSVNILVRHMVTQGARHIGYVGDPKHCCSFEERWVAYTYALWQHGITPNPAQCICDPDSVLYGDTDWLRSKLEAMPEIPDAFFCANDFLAIRLMSALKQMGLAIPERVMVAGFDGTPQASVVEPALTTAAFSVVKMSRVAATMLLSRIQSPDREFCCTYVKTTPVFRASTLRTPG